MQCAKEYIKNAKDEEDKLFYTLSSLSDWQPQVMEQK